MLDIFHTIAKALVAPWVFTLSLAGYNLNPPPVVQPAPIIQQITQPDYSLDILHLKTRVSILEQSDNLGASSILPTTIALFATSLQSAITSSASTMTLVSSSYNNGASTLASSTYAFILDEGTASQEFVIADCTATACTNMSRGLSFLDGKTSVTSLQFSHRRGASVKITDAPILLLVNGFLNNTVGIPSPFSYDPSVATTSFTNGSNIIDKAYVDSIAIAGASIINATTGARGIVQLATAAQAASTTATGSSGAALVLAASNATSTCQSTGNYAVITDNNGKINGNCFGSLALPNATLTGTTTFSSTATSSVIFSATSSPQLGSTPIVDIGKHTKIFTSGTSTWAVPQGISLVKIEMVGGGGGSDAGISGSAAGGGGGGGYCLKYLDVSATTSVQVGVGVGGTAAKDGSRSSFGGWTLYYATGGSASVSNTAGGGGIGTNCDLNVKGQPGEGASTLASLYLAGAGGGTVYGSGGQSFFGNGGSTGGAGGAYGGGASGGGAGSGAGGTGANGLVILTW